MRLRVAIAFYLFIYVLFYYSPSPSWSFSVLFCILHLIRTFASWQIALIARGVREEGQMRSSPRHLLGQSSPFLLLRIDCPSIRLSVCPPYLLPSPTMDSPLPVLIIRLEWVRDPCVTFSCFDYRFSGLRVPFYFLLRRNCMNHNLKWFAFEWDALLKFPLNLLSIVKEPRRVWTTRS